MPDGHHGHEFASDPEVESIYVVPVDDLIGHDTDTEECVCGPEIEPVERDDGSIAWLFVHHSLDGRENHE
jgi:hypothetical protein